jgi:pyruvate carboxylase
MKPAIAVKIVSESDRPVCERRKVVAENSADLSTRMMGYVTKVYVQIGQKSAGQTLVSINNSDLKESRQMLLFFRQPRDTTMPRKITIVL